MIDTVGYTVMPNTNHKKDKRMATSPVKHKSPMDTLLESVTEIVEDGAKGMNQKELRESEKRFNKALDRGVASRRRRRETA
jgi:hypothetical protein